jgi:chemotaxis protein MotB
MRSRRRHNQETNPELPGNGWLVTFNDMMTLLLVFFVLLFSMGDIDGPMVKHFQKSLRSGLGLMFAGQPAMETIDDETRDFHRPSSVAPARTEPVPSDLSPRQRARRIVDRINAQSGGQQLKLGEKGQILMDSGILFSFGKAELNHGAVIILGRLANELRAIPNRIRVEGHTDNIPIRTARYPSNWELSAARAVNVVKHFAGPGGIAPGRLSAAGYADAKPLWPNTTAENRAGNRRVEIVLLKGKIQ